MNTKQYEIEANSDLDFLNIPGVLCVAELTNTRERYWDHVIALVEAMVQQYKSQDMLSWEDFVNSTLTELVKGSLWTTEREACLTMLATTNNYNAWLEFEEPLGTNPVQTMAECAMARDLMDYCADVVYELDAEEYGE